MKLTVENIDKNTIKLDIEIDAETAAQEYNKACRKISEHVNIPGFRKGKAPRAVIEKYVGPERIQRDAMDRLLPTIFADAISEHQFDLASEPYVESFNFEVGKPLTVVAKLEIKPEVNLKDYKSLVVDVNEFKHPQDALDRELRMLAERFATLEPVIDRETVNTDIVVMDFAGFVDGEAIKGGSAKNYQLDLANSNFIPGFAEQLVGKKISEDFEIKVTFPENYHDESLKGKEAKFDIKINEIKQKITPELNDELAKKVGPFDSMESLKKDITAYLEKTEKLENDNRSQKALLDKVVDTAEVEVPDSMINREAKVLMEEVQQKMQAQGVAWEQVLDQQGHENMWNNLREEATKRIKNSLVLGAIAKAEDIKVSDDDFTAKVSELAAMYNTDEKTIYKQMAQNHGMAQVLTQQLLGQNITKFLVENNEVKFVPEKTEELAKAE